MKINIETPLINKKYIYAKLQRNIMLIPAAMNIGFAASEAMAHNGPTTTFLTLQGFVLLKIAEKAINKMLEYKGEYQKIVERAININKIRQANISKKIDKMA